MELTGDAAAIAATLIGADRLPGLNRVIHGYVHRGFWQVGVAAKRASSPAGGGVGEEGGGGSQRTSQSQEGRGSSSRSSQDVAFGGLRAGRRHAPPPDDVSARVALRASPHSVLSPGPLSARRAAPRLGRAS